MIIDPLGHPLRLVFQSVPVYLLQDRVTAPASTLLDIGVRDAQGMLDASRVVPEIMETKMRKSGALKHVLKTMGDVIRIEFRQTPGLASPMGCYEVRIFDIPVTGV